MVKTIVSLVMSGIKRAASEISKGKTLEETVFEYINKNQEREYGKGVGMPCDHLNKNIEHSEKPCGSGSEGRFVTLMRAMPSLIESKDTWEGKIVFLLKPHNAYTRVALCNTSELMEAENMITTVTDAMQKPLNDSYSQSELVEAENTIKSVTDEMYTRLYEMHPPSGRRIFVGIPVEDYKRDYEELLAAAKSIRIARNRASN